MHSEFLEAKAARKIVQETNTQQHEFDLKKNTYHEERTKMHSHMVGSQTIKNKCIQNFWKRKLLEK